MHTVVDGAHAGAGPAAAAAVPRLGAADGRAPHLTVRAVHHLYELSAL